MAADADLQIFFDELFRAYGPQGWWPGDSALEVVVGAILTQNTNWRNVERAIARLREANALSWRRLHALAADELAELIRPAGTFRVKARRLKAFVDFFYSEYGGRWSRLAAAPTETLRSQLLSVSGIGPETADAILLYALQRPKFVIDAYTRRVMVRHGKIDRKAGYGAVQSLFEGSLPADERTYNEYHALLVRLAKLNCRAKPQCSGCPLEKFPHTEEPMPKARPRRRAERKRVTARNRR